MKFSEFDTSTKVILKVILAGLLLAFLWFTRDILMLLLIALIVASAMDPMVNYLKEKKIPRVVSVLAVYVLVIGLAALVIYSIIPPVVSQFKVLQSNLTNYSQIIESRLSWLLDGATLGDYFHQAISGISSGQGVVSSTFGAFNGVLDFIAVLVIAFYLVAEEKGMKTFIASLIPAPHHEFSMALVEKVQKKVGMWVLGQIIVSLGIFLFTFVGLSILKVQYALVLALVAGLLEIIPYIGPFVSAVPALLIAFIQHPPLAFGVAILYILVHEVEGYVLVPKIMEKTVGTSPLVVMIALLVGFQLAGIIGLLIAVPLVAALTVVINEFWPNKAI